MRLPEWLPDTQRPTGPERGPRRALIERLDQPLSRFLHVEAGGGLVLLACTVIDLVPADALSGAVLLGERMESPPVESRTQAGKGAAIGATVGGILGATRCRSREYLGSTIHQLEENVPCAASRW